MASTRAAGKVDDAGATLTVRDISRSSSAKAARVLAAAGVVSSLLATARVSHAEPCDPPRIMIVMDGSSSMLGEVTEAGVTVVKWAAAQNAVKSVTDAYADAAQWGLMAFPGPGGGCNTGTVLVDVAASTGPTIQSALDAIDMSGTRQTPAGQTLKAASMLPGLTGAGHKNYVIFVTDGWQFCSVDVADKPPVCVMPTDCDLMGVSSCPSCDACNTASTHPMCAGYADGCFCVRKWPVLGVEALAAAGVKTFVVGFGSAVDAPTLNEAAHKGGTAIPGCDPTASTPSCFYKATVPSEFTAALKDIVQKVASETCTADCGITGTRTCTATGWSDCVAPPDVDCVGPCGTAGKQKCVQGTLSACDAVCDDAGSGGASGAAGASGSSGAGGSSGAAGSIGEGGAAGGAASGGDGGASGGATSGNAGDDGQRGLGNDADSGDEGGCACRIGGRSPGAHSLIALGFVAALIASVRRRLAKPLR